MAKQAKTSAEWEREAKSLKKENRALVQMFEEPPDELAPFDLDDPFAEIDAPDEPGGGGVEALGTALVAGGLSYVAEEIGGVHGGGIAGAAAAMFGEGQVRTMGLCMVSTWARDQMRNRLGGRSRQALSTDDADTGEAPSSGGLTLLKRKEKKA